MVESGVGSCSANRACTATASSGMVRTKSPRQYHCRPFGYSGSKADCSAGIRHGPDALPLRLLLPDRRERGVGVGRVAGVAPHHAACLLQVQLGRERVPGRNGHRGEEAVEVLVLRGHEVPVPAQHVGGRRHRPQGRPGDHVPHRVQPEHERGHDPEVAAAAAQRPEQVGMLASPMPSPPARRPARPRPRAGCRWSARTCGTGSRARRPASARRRRWWRGPRTAGPARARASPRRRRPRSRRPAPGRSARPGRRPPRPSATGR